MHPELVLHPNERPRFILQLLDNLLVFSRNAHFLPCGLRLRERAIWRRADILNPFELILLVLEPFGGVIEHNRDCVPHLSQDSPKMKSVLSGLPAELRVNFYKNPGDRIEFLS